MQLELSLFLQSCVLYINHYLNEDLMAMEKALQSILWSAISLKVLWKFCWIWGWFDLSWFAFPSGNVFVEFITNNYVAFAKYTCMNGYFINISLVSLLSVSLFCLLTTADLGIIYLNIYTCTSIWARIFKLPSLKTATVLVIRANAFTFLTIWLIFKSHLVQCMYYM